MRVRRKASACALPRPSATASAKLANSTVNHSQKAIWPENSAEPLLGDEIADEEQVTTSDTTSVTKITGLCASCRGSSLRKASTAAAAMILGSNRPCDFAFEDMGSISDQKVLPPSIRKCSTTGPSASAGKYCSR